MFYEPECFTISVDRAKYLISEAKNYNRNNMVISNNLIEEVEAAVNDGEAVVNGKVFDKAKMEAIQVMLLEKCLELEACIGTQNRMELIRRKMRVDIKYFYETYYEWLSKKYKKYNDGVVNEMLNNLSELYKIVSRCIDFSLSDVYVCWTNIQLCFLDLTLK